MNTSADGHSAVPASFVEKTVFSPLNSLCAFVKNQLSVCVGLCLGSSVPVMYLYAFTPIPHCLEYWCQKWGSARPSTSPVFIITLSILGLLNFHIIFKIQFFNLCKDVYCNLIEISLNLIDQFGNNWHNTNTDSSDPWDWCISFYFSLL